MNLREFGRRLIRLIGRHRADRDLDEEMALHVDLRTARYVTRGLPPEEAARTARRALGSALRLREQSRDAWAWRRLDELECDVRHAFRTLRRSPIFTLSAILTLALAIGVNIAIFSLVDRIIFRPLPVPDPADLVTVLRTSDSRGVQLRRTSLTWERVTRIRDMSTLESTAVATSSLDRASKGLILAVDGGEVVAPVDGKFVSANYFRVLGLSPALGRDFGPEDDTAAAPPVVMLSYKCWRTRLHGATDVVGRSIRINGADAVVVGVGPASFTGTDLGVAPPDVYLPLSTAPRLATSRGSQTNGRGGFASGTPSTVGGSLLSPVSPAADFQVIGRLPARTASQAHAELASRLGSGEWAFVPVAETMLALDARAELRQFLGLLAAAAGLTLLIGCANLASLLLARTEERRSEIAIRAALGAGRGRLVQELAVEAAVLVTAGGVAGLVLARWVDAALAPFILPGGVAVSSLRSGLETRAVVFALGATIVAAILIGFASVARAASRDLALGIKKQGGRSPRLGLARVLVAVQATICVLLLFSAALFARTLANALSTDLGFDPAGLASATVSVPSNSTDILYGLNAVDALLTRVREIPGVSAATVGPLPLVRGSDLSRDQIQIDGVTVTVPVPVDVVYAAADYFSTLAQRVVRGRDFTERDAAEARPVVIVNEAAARQFWPDRDPLDHQVALPRIGMQAGGPAFVVVGVVGDVKLKSLAEAARPVLYLARMQHQAFMAGFMAGAGNSFLIVRTNGDPAGLGASLARLAGDAHLSLQVVTTLDQTVNQMLMPQRLGRALLMLLGATALTLTVVGVYGLVSCVVSRGRKEIGVRMALGAGAYQVIHALVSTTVLPILSGAATGAVLAWWGGRFADRFMYGMKGSDPTTIALAVAVMLGTGLLAAVLPTRRALKIDPLETLRTD